ncbi:hypothetical protein AgCh_024873 [Apium graveolens]
MEKLKAMKETLVKGRQMQDDCFAVVKKLRAIIHSTEEQLRVHKKQTLFLTHLTTKTLPKGLHCLPLRLTTEELGGKCVLAESTVYVLLEGGLVSTLKSSWRENEGYEVDNNSIENSWSNPNFELSIPPNKVIEEVNTLHKNPSILFEYSVEDTEASKPFDLEFSWINPVVWSSPKAPLSASRFLTGSGNVRGAIAISLESSGRKCIIQTDDVNEERCGLRVYIFQVVPWYVKVYYHTTQLFVDEQAQTLGEFVEKMRVSSSEDKVSPGVMEMS